MEVLGVAKIIGELFTGWFKRKHEIQKKELEHIAQIDANEFAIEYQKQKNLEHSWKDEYITVIVSLPLILIFIPGAQPAVLEGFAALDKTPDWYQWVMMGVITAAAGIPMYGKLKKYNQ